MLKISYFKTDLNQVSSLLFPPKIFDFCVDSQKINGHNKVIQNKNSPHALDFTSLHLVFLLFGPYLILVWLSDFFPDGPFRGWWEAVRNDGQIEGGERRSGQTTADVFPPQTPTKDLANFIQAERSPSSDPSPKHRGRNVITGLLGSKPKAQSLTATLIIKSI